MAFITGSNSFLQFELDIKTAPGFTQEHLDSLESFRLGHKAAESADGRAFGWGAGDHARDAKFDELKCIYPNGLIFDFVVETNKLPTDRYKEYYAVELASLASLNPSGLPSKRNRREAEGAAIDRLEQEAKDGRFKKWSQIPIFWDSKRGRIYYGSASLAHVGRFSDLFEDTFGLSRGQLQSVTAGSIGLDAIRGTNLRIEGIDLSEFVPGTTPKRPEWDLAGRPDWFGNEFLVWLWCGRGGSVLDEVEFDDNSKLVGMFRGGVKLDCASGETGDDTINAVSGPRTREAREALRVGKLPREAGFTIVYHDNQYEFKFDSELLAFKSVKLPKREGNPRAVAEARLDSIRELSEVFEGLYLKFLSLRFSDEWLDELSGIQQFIKSR